MNEKAAICYNFYMETRLSAHSAYRTEYHIVWIPKYRRLLLNPGLCRCLRKLFPKILRSLLSCEIIEYNIQVDHIHMNMIIPPKYSVSDVIGQKSTIRQQSQEKFFLAVKNILEREYRLVIRLLCLNGGY